MNKPVPRNLWSTVDTILQMRKNRITRASNNEINIHIYASENHWKLRFTATSDPFNVRA